ncbi:MAG: CPBP family intramembrane glutamic endopeptidase [Myxococcota bacterium]
MPQPVLFDHLLIALLVGLVPFLAARSYRRLVRQIEAGVPRARVRQYRRTTVVQWIMALALVAVWVLVDRALDVLGFTVPGGGRLAIGAGVTALGLAFLTGQWRAVRRMEDEDLAEMQEGMTFIAPILPRTGEEAAHFRVLSVTAGICEEIVYRGYMIWYLAVFMGPWPAALAAGALFGVLHLYQGTQGIVRTGAVGVVMGLLYVGSGSLLWPVILHAAVDLNGGAIGRRVMTA